MKKILFIIALAASLSRAASFDTTQTVFYSDSAQYIRVFMGESDCLSFLCQLKISGQDSPGMVFSPVQGKPGDTVSVIYDFPTRSIKANRAGVITLQFSRVTGDAKVLAMAGPTLKPKPIPTSLRPSTRPGKALAAPLASFRIDGRVKP